MKDHFRRARCVIYCKSLSTETQASNK